MSNCHTHKTSLIFFSAPLSHVASTQNIYNTRSENIMLRVVVFLVLGASASAADISAHAEMSKIGKSLSEALSRVKTTGDASNAGRSLLELDGSFCGFMTTATSCALANSASCSSLTGCVLSSGTCSLDPTGYTTLQLVTIAADTDYAFLAGKATSCAALTATQCASDATCEFEGQCDTSDVWTLVWLANKCPSMASLISRQLAAEGITQADVHAEANAAGISVSPEFQAAMNAEGVASNAMRLSSALFATLGAAAFALA